MEPQEFEAPPQILIDQLYAQLSTAIADNIVLQSKLTYALQINNALEQRLNEMLSSTEDETN